MAIRVPRGKSDEKLERIIEALDRYQADHPQAEIELYRRNPVSVRVRVLDPGFSGKSDVQRSLYVWRYFDDLSEDEQGDIHMLLLLTPDETETSPASMEFDHPLPSRV